MAINLSGAIGNKTAPPWAPDATFNGNLSLWTVAADDLARRGELDLDERVLVGVFPDLTLVRRCGHDDAKVAQGLYLAQKKGKGVLHRDGTWAPTALDPSLPRPTPGGPPPHREAFAGLWDDLPTLLVALRAALGS